MHNEQDSNLDKLQQIVEAIGVGTWEWDIVNDRVNVNARWKDMLGYGAEELPEISSKIWSDMMHPDDRAAVLNELQIHLADPGHRYQVQFRFRRRDGQYLWIEAPGKVTERDEKGRPLKMFGVHLDITQNKRREAEVKKREEELNLFFRQSLDGFFFMMLDEPVTWDESVDRDAVMEKVFRTQRLTRINKAMLEQYGMKEEDMIGLTPNDFFAHDLVAGRKAWFELFDSGRLHTETDERRADGSQLYVEGDYLLMYDAEGRVTGHFGVQRDVTVQKTAEARLQEANQELKSTVETLQNTRNELISHERMAAVGQLAAGVAHNFNNILMGIMGSLEVLKLDPQLTRNQADLADRAMSVVMQAGNLVKQITDYGRKGYSTVKQLELNSFLEQSRNILEAGMSMNHSLQFTFDRKNSLTVAADGKQLEQALLNLIFNARDAMEEGGTIEICTGILQSSEAPTCVICKQPFQGEYAYLSVRDEGSGIPESVLPKIFEPFFTTKHMARGTGLGLSQVYGIINQMKAHLTLDTAPGQGTAFHLYFPLTSGEEERIPTLLIVDDDTVILESLTVILEKEGYSILRAENGAEGLKIFRQHKDSIDLVISDIKMPLMDGLDLRREILQTQPEQKFIFLTGFEDFQNADELQGSSPVLTLTKPLHFDELRKQVSEILGH